MHDITLRDVRPDEAARFSLLMRDLFVAAYRDCSTPENVASFLRATYSEAQQRAELQDGDIESIVAERGADWLGFAQLRFGKTPPQGVGFARGAELGRLYLAPQAQGVGLGSAMLREIERRARARGGDGLWLNVWQQAPQAQAFYRREGFGIVGTTDFIVGDDAKTDWRMAKPL